MVLKACESKSNASNSNNSNEINQPDSKKSKSENNLKATSTSTSISLNQSITNGEENTIVATKRARILEKISYEDLENDTTK